MSEAENEAIVRRWFPDGVNQHNLSLIEELIAEDFNDGFGHDGVRWLVSTVRSAFPDLHFQIDDTIAQGDKVVTRWTMRGTHHGSLAEVHPIYAIPPTGKSIEWRGIHIWRVADGKLAEDWAVFDHLSLLEQLGIVPSPAS